MCASEESRRRPPSATFRLPVTSCDPFCMKYKIVGECAAGPLVTNRPFRIIGRALINGRCEIAEFHLEIRLWSLYVVHAARRVLDALFVCFDDSSETADSADKRARYCLFSCRDLTSGFEFRTGTSWFLRTFRRCLRFRVTLKALASSFNCFSIEQGDRVRWRKSYGTRINFVKIHFRINSVWQSQITVISQQCPTIKTFTPSADKEWHTHTHARTHVCMDPRCFRSSIVSTRPVFCFKLFFQRTYTVQIRRANSPDPYCTN